MASKVVFPIFLSGLFFSQLATVASASNPPTAGSIAAARKELAESVDRLDRAGAEWRVASADLKRFAGCNLNPDREIDVGVIQGHERKLEGALARLKSSLRKLDDGANLFSGKIQADACREGPDELAQRFSSYEALVREQSDRNFPARAKGEFERTLDGAQAALNKSIAEYEAKNCRGGFSLWCSGARSCAGGRDPGQIYQKVKQQMDAVKESLLAAEDRRPASVRSSMGGLARATAQDRLRLVALVNSCNTAGTQAAPLASNGIASTAAPAPAPVQQRAEAPSATVVAAERAPAPEDQVVSPAPVSRPTEGAPQVNRDPATIGSTQVVGELIREQREAAQLQASQPEPAPVAAPLAPPAAPSQAALPDPQPTPAEPERAVQKQIPQAPEVLSEQDKWAKPDWKKYDDYKASIGAPNRLEGVDLNRSYRDFLTSNSIQIRSAEDVVRLQKAINATSIEVNGPDSIGPSVYQDGVMGSRTKSAVHMMQTDPVYREVFLRELRRQGLARSGSA